MLSIRQEGPAIYEDITAKAMAEVPLRGNVSVVFMLRQYKDHLEYDIHLNAPNSDASCISWAIGVPGYLNGGNECHFLNSQCANTIPPNACLSGLGMLGECGAILTRSGLNLSSYAEQAGLLIQSARTNAITLYDKHPNSIIGKGILVSYSSTKGEQELACGTIFPGQGGFGDFSISTQARSGIFETTTLIERQTEWPINQLIESQGKIAMARIPLGENSTVVFMFQQMEDRLEVNIFFDAPASDGACMSWGIGFPQIVDDVCVSGFSNITACGGFYTISGMKMDQYKPQTHVNLFNFHTNTMTLGPSRHYNILLKSIMVVYATKDNSTQQIACSNIVLGKGSETNFTIKTTNGNSNNIPRNGFRFGFGLALASLMYHIGL
ncbi:hypothetical protein CLU79DRAFT_837119 [Phycomyces nitens]|nr:hypothetical protein CLU79DRAFT_837119 [Phycomyces nitens]